MPKVVRKYLSLINASNSFLTSVCDRVLALAATPVILS